MSTAEATVGKNQFKCFHCRHVFAKKDGDWFNWDQMQVHLCNTCDKSTKQTPQRSYGND
jgi:hypothetical protein